MRVVIEAPRGSFVKRRADGGLDYVSPLPVPFNYGAVPGTRGEDGDPLDAIVLGPTRRAGEVVEVDVYGVVRFLDAGQRDDKLVCAPLPPSAWEWGLVATFFAAFARAKRALNAARRASGPTRVVGIERGEGGP